MAAATASSSFSARSPLSLFLSKRFLFFGSSSSSSSSVSSFADLVRLRRSLNALSHAARVNRFGDSPYSPLNWGSRGPRFSDQPPTEMARLSSRRDYEHWLTKQQMIDCNGQTVAKVLGSDESEHQWELQNDLDPNLLDISNGSVLVKNLPFLLLKPTKVLASRQKNITSLKVLTDSRDLKSGKAVHAHLIRALHFDLILTNALINLYAKCGRIVLARQIFDAMPERNVVSYSALMAGYLHDGAPSEVLEVFKLTCSSEFRVRPNEFVFATALASCSDMGALEEGVQCHAHVLKSGLVLYPYVKNAVLYMYLRCLGVGDAFRVFQTESGLDIYSCNSMINGFLEHGYLGEGLEVLGSIVKDIEMWDHVTFLTVLGLCAGLKDLKLGSGVHSQILKRGIESNLFVGNGIIDMYGKCSEILSARNAFDELRSRNVVSWTGVMAAHTQNGFFEEALNLFLKMVAYGIQPNEFTYAVMLNSCASLSALRHGDALNAHAVRLGFKAHLIVENALINMYSRSGSIEDAHRVFACMLRWDIISWNSMISGFSHHGLGKEALEVFHHMLMEKVVPNYVTFIGVLSACGCLGLVDDGFYYLNQMMRETRITPGVEHYTCIVGLLCRAGLLDEANRFMRSTDTEWDVVAWRTLLSACQIYQNYGLGKRVAEHILQFSPDDVGTYILLSNMHAKAKRWDGVVKIRKLMKGRELKKEPGISWIQVRNETHVFVSEDKKHPKVSQIYEKLTELLAEIKVLGYVPDIANVLHDVEDEQKEDCLSYHSEKLAITFGLISTPSGAPIHIIKNLRMCDDCHTAIKLISNVTNRKIIVRDANRFHCFESAACSCGDYW